MATGRLTEQNQSRCRGRFRDIRNEAPVIILILAAIAAVPALAVARSESLDSIEILTADADLVVVGNITAVAPDPDGTMYSFQVTIDVKETLKGAGGESITAVAITGRSTELEAWRDRKADLLFFVQGRELRGRLPIIELDRGASHGADERVVTMDFDVLTTREEILRAARAGCSVPSSDRSRTRFRLDPPPRSSALGRLLKGQVMFVVVPEDGRLERRARTWAASESLEYRCLAPWALSPFPSKENAAILLRLVVDDLHMDFPDGHGGVTIRYPLRRAAYNALRWWGVEIKEPIEEVHVGADVWTPKDDPRADSNSTKRNEPS